MRSKNTPPEISENNTVNDSQCSFRISTQKQKLTKNIYFASFTKKKLIRHFSAKI